MNRSHNEHCITVPKQLRSLPGFTGSRNKRAEGLSYIFEKSKRWLTRNFNAIEVSKALGISERGALKMLKGLEQMGYMTSVLVRIDIPLHLQQHGITHFFRRSFYIVSSVINSLFSLFYKKVSSATVLEYSTKNNTPAKLLRSIGRTGARLFGKCLGWIDEMKKRGMEEDIIKTKLDALMRLYAEDYK